MKVLFYLLIISQSWTSSFSLMKIPQVASFITEFLDASELQHVYQNIMICKDIKFLATLLSNSRKRFLHIKSSKHSNVSNWNVSNGPQGFVLDMDCPHAEHILRQASELNLLRSPYSWLLLGHEELTAYNLNENNGCPLYGLESLYPRLDSLVVIAMPKPPDKIHMFEVYKIRREQRAIVLEFGEWKVGGPISRNNHQVKAYRRFNLNQTVITGTIVITHPESINLLHTFKHKHLDTSSRLSYKIVEAISTVLNAKLDVVVTDTWGYALANGSWSGMIGHILAGMADIGCCPQLIFPTRFDHVDYVWGLTQTNGAVWISSAGLIVTISLLLFLTAKYEDGIRGSAPPDKESLTANWSDIAMLNLGAICQQGCDSEPRGASGRIVTIILYLAIMFLYVSYSASIVALLQSSDTSITTMKDLLDSPLQCGAEDIPYHRNGLKASTDPVRQELYRKKIAPNGEEHGNYVTLEEGIQLLRQGLYAFHVEHSPGYSVVQQTFLESEKCGLQELPSFFLSAEPWIPMMKNSPLGEHFKIAVKLVKEGGLESRATQNLFTKKPRCSQPGSKFVSVGLIDSSQIFFILIYGVITSIIIFIIERITIIRLVNFQS